ncbi:sulfurtransferase TusA family protein [Sphingomonas sp.]|uniref:sulfurtransferase TusA family protein n=1 Tax=Sphingomonas sp. TaxID=28214 RepID=UPI002CAB8212|nr:sulfurtransferase TusA family protein [Sphingomonas sp.]HWK36552.1 sulfurtransferase TusA family protein [Sphingomonas sp.]
MIEIDARGMRCPWPAIRLARTLRDHPAAAVAILADDPAAPGELAAVARLAGRTLHSDGPARFRIDAGG